MLVSNLSFRAYQCDPWVVVAASQISRRHQAEGKGNEDAFAVGAVGSSLWLVVADGVSRAERGGEGSRIAVEALNKALNASLADDAVPTAETLPHAYAAAHTALKSHARECRAKLDQFASTLVCALIHPAGVFAGNIGDSTAAYWGPSLRENASLCDAIGHHIQPGVYGIQREDWKRFARFRSGFPLHAVHAVALATDGAENGFRYSSTGPLKAFSSPLASLPHDFAKDGLDNFPTAFLYLFAHINPRHDDCTLIYALRTDKPVPPHVEPR